MERPQGASVDRQLWADTSDAILQGQRLLSAHCAGPAGSSCSAHSCRSTRSRGCFTASRKRTLVYRAVLGLMPHVGTKRPQASSSGLQVLIPEAAARPRRRVDRHTSDASGRRIIRWCTQAHEGLCCSSTSGPDTIQTSDHRAQGSVEWASFSLQLPDCGGDGDDTPDQVG